jgi:hypothetical protein
MYSVIQGNVHVADNAHYRERRSYGTWSAAWQAGALRRRREKEALRLRDYTGWFSRERFGKPRHWLVFLSLSR